MAQRTVKLFATLREMAGANELTVSLEDGDTVRELVEAVGKVCPQLGAPVATMVSYAIIYRRGLATYCDEAAASGVAGFDSSWQVWQLRTSCGKTTFE